MGEGDYFGKLGVPPLAGAERETAVRAQGPPAQKKNQIHASAHHRSLMVSIARAFAPSLKRFLPFFTG